MKNEEAMANFILKEAEIKDSLRKILRESAWEYYTGRYLFGLITSLLLLGMLFYFCIFKSVIPIWGLYAIVIAVIALMESKRNTGRVDAMIKLSELDSNRTNAAIKASPNQQDT